MNYLSKLKIQLANYFPFTSRLSRLIKATYHAISNPKNSYSQHGEDVFIWNKLREAFPGVEYNYIDIGAFHPVLLSNTYLLYRKKMKGITVEPNIELSHLHKLFRPADIQLQIACSAINGLSKFYFQQTFPALSSLNDIHTKRKVKERYVPVLNLDTICQSLGLLKVHFLSIDVEGFDFEVLEGGQNLLPNVFLICIECDTPDMEDKVRLFLNEKGFIFLKQFSCNLVFRNENFSLN